MSAVRAVFVDTGAWVALRYKRDQYHARARTLLKRLQAGGLGLVTTEWVLAETVTLLKARGAVDHAIALGVAVQGGRLGILVESTRERRAQAWSLFERFRALRVGWVDCASFAVMQELGLRQAFGFDDDFVRAGFELFR
jgi:predicted nucleic acid-binding protein